MKVLDPSLHPENQLWRLTGLLAKEQMETHNRRRDSLSTLEEWEILRQEKKKAFLKAFPPFLFEKCPLKARIVSNHTLEHYRIENVLFESIPGWEVNATLYLPKEPGVYPAVVCPTGSSTKVRLGYQRPAQIFARNGYIAVSIDPPGFVGERRLMNDCFITGQSGFLTGIWCQANYIVDTLRCLDYLDIRPDVERSKGYAMSGLSLGGFMTSLCGWMDDRITCLAPVCSVKSHLQNDIIERYTAQPSSWYTGFFKSGIDTADLLCMAAPKPCLIHAGRLDEVLDSESAAQVYREVEHIYSLYKARDMVELFIDDCPHEYSARMAMRTVEWMNRLIAPSPQPLNTLTDSDMVYVEPEYLLCRPSNQLNYYTLNKRESARLEAERAAISKTPEELQALLRQTLCLTDEESVMASTQKQIDGPAWVHTLYGVDLTLAGEVHLPGLLLKRTDAQKMPALLFLDENGKWEWLYKTGPLARCARFLDRTRDDREPMVLSLDLSGWGELAPQPASYELAEWGDTVNSIAYVGLGTGLPVMGIRVREAMAALAWLENRPDVDKEHLYIGGRGQGAVVALLAAVLSGKTRKLACVDMISHFAAMLDDYPNGWKSDLMIPEVLKFYDLPDLLEVYCGQILMVNPLDGTKKPVMKDKAELIYEKALNRGMQLLAAQSGREAEQSFVDFILS